MKKISLAVALYTLAKSDETFLACMLSWKPGSNQWTIGWFDYPDKNVKQKQIAHCWINFKIKYQTWQPTFSQHGEHNCYILLIKDKNKSSFKCYKPCCPMIEIWHGKVPDKSYCRIALCALDCYIYVCISALRDSFFFRRDS